MIQIQLGPVTKYLLHEHICGQKYDKYVSNESIKILKGIEITSSFDYLPRIFYIYKNGFIFSVCVL